MKISIKNFGPIQESVMDFGDLTFLIGPQASGKSLSLELFKLMLDKQHIISTLRNYNFILNKTNSNKILEWYFGEGLSLLFKKDTKIELDGVPFTTDNLLKVVSKQRAADIHQESVFYVPAQRILSISDGRPKNFTEFDIDTPYVLRRFSETLRVFLQGGLGNPDTIFPMRNRLKAAVKNSINRNVFHNGKVVLDQTGSQRKMKLNIGGMNIPFMAWSAGQKEFMPLLLAIYCLSGPPTQVVDKSDYKWVIIEEPEMGLHPQAIQSVLLEIFELIQNGYKVIVSTHSSMFMEFVWTFNNLNMLGEDLFKESLCQLFSVHTDASAAHLFSTLKTKDIKTYYSGGKGYNGRVRYVDVSSLDAFNENIDIAEWGGLTSFAGRASEIVSRYGQDE